MSRAFPPEPGEAFPIYRAYGESKLRQGVVLTLYFHFTCKTFDQFRLIDRNERSRSHAAQCRTQKKKKKIERRRKIYSLQKYNPILGVNLSYKGRVSPKLGF